jgi:putative DNA primase/helicase
MSAAEVIATALGPVQRSGEWWRCVCPVHRSRTGRSASLALRDGDHGLIVHCHAGCSRDEILAELCRRGLIPMGGNHRRPRRSPQSSRRLQASIPPDQASDAEVIGWACQIWDRAVDANGTPVAAYLAARGIMIAPPPCLRWSPSLRRPDKTCAPGIVGLVQHVEKGVVAVHRTYLCRDEAGIWRRLDRASLGPVGGGAVVLAPPSDRLMVGEGIESCLAAMQATGLPACAALSAGGIEALLLPNWVRRVVILADNDANLRGQAAALKAAQRWTAEGRSVRIAMPPTPGTDMADVLIGCSCSNEVHHVAA